MKQAFDRVYKRLKEADLKPCPFCGGKAILANIGMNWITCTECDVETPWYEESEDAIEAWNRRT